MQSLDPDAAGFGHHDDRDALLQTFRRDASHETARSEDSDTDLIDDSACFPFLKLPAEIRIMIYSFVLVPKPRARGPILRGSFDTMFTSILYVNKQIHEEATTVMYEQNLFTVIQITADARIPREIPRINAVKKHDGRKTRKIMITSNKNIASVVTIRKGVPPDRRDSTPLIRYMVRVQDLRAVVQGLCVSAYCSPRHSLERTHPLSINLEFRNSGIPAKIALQSRLRKVFYPWGQMRGADFTLHLPRPVAIRETAALYSVDVGRSIHDTTCMQAFTKINRMIWSWHTEVNLWPSVGRHAWIWRLHSFKVEVLEQLIELYTILRKGKPSQEEKYRVLLSRAVFDYLTNTIATNVLLGLCMPPKPCSFCSLHDGYWKYRFMNNVTTDLVEAVTSVMRRPRSTINLMLVDPGIEGFASWRWNDALRHMGRDWLKPEQCGGGTVSRWLFSHINFRGPTFANIDDMQLPARTEESLKAQYRRWIDLQHEDPNKPQVNCLGLPPGDPFIPPETENNPRWCYMDLGGGWRSRITGRNGRS